jgi:hypothetical protein
MVPPCSSHHKALPIHRSVWKDYYRLIAQAAPGVALFAAGLTIAAGKIILNLEVGRPTRARPEPKITRCCPSIRLAPWFTFATDFLSVAYAAIIACGIRSFIVVPIISPFPISERRRPEDTQGCVLRLAKPVVHDDKRKHRWPSRRDGVKTAHRPGSTLRVGKNVHPTESSGHAG